MIMLKAFVIPLSAMSIVRTSINYRSLDLWTLNLITLTLLLDRITSLQPLSSLLKDVPRRIVHGLLNTITIVFHGNIKRPSHRTSAVRRTRNPAYCHCNTIQQLLMIDRLFLFSREARRILRQVGPRSVFSQHFTLFLTAGRDTACCHGSGGVDPTVYTAVRESYGLGFDSGNPPHVAGEISD